MDLMFLSASDVSLADGALYAVIGFIIVLLVLALLVGIFSLSGMLFKSKLFNKEAAPDKSAVAPEPEAASDEDEEVVAAITAAIACVLESESGGEAPEFVIRRIKRNK